MKIIEREGFLPERAVDENGNTVQIALVWTNEDVFCLLEDEYSEIELTDKEKDEIASSVLEALIDNVDCEIGMNWESLRFALDEEMRFREQHGYSEEQVAK
jgi:hypothetical protein